MTARPTGTVTFLFTDVEGSTSAWEAHPAPMAQALARHDAIVRGAIERAGGYVFSTAGDGFAAAFARPADALAAAVSAQRALSLEAWPAPVTIRVRIGLHTGDAIERDGDYFGPSVNRAARITSAAHGGQILASAATAALLDADAAGTRLRDLGEHRLRDLDGMERLAQVSVEGLRDTFPALRTADRFASTLPVQRSSFIGREEERRRVRQALEASRLVTLTGVGGTGKTRLAIEVAHDLAEVFPAGTFFIDLARIGDGALVWEAFAAGLDFAPDAGAAVAPQVTSRLGRKEVLLVVDNCEHVIDDAAEAIDEVLAACPAVSVLATSREGLGLDGERVVPVRPLSTEPGDERTAPAVRLFLDRAASAHGATFGPGDMAAIRELCARLDGLPLALELAAGRAGVLTPADLLARLEDRFRLLTGGRRGKRNRQRTLEETIAWSYDLLGPDEQALLRRLSVFPASFDLARAAAVAGGDELPTLDLLEALAARSLLQVERRDDGQTRYRLLETIREYAQARLADAGDAETARLRHLQDTTARMEAAYEHVFRLPPEVDELRDDVLAALERADALGRHDLLARLAAASPAIFTARGLLAPARIWLTRALEVATPERRGAVRVALGWIEMLRSSFGAMVRHARAADADPDPNVEAQAVFMQLVMETPRNRALAEELAARAEAFIAGGRTRLAGPLGSAVGGFHFWYERDDAAAVAFDAARAHARDDDSIAAAATAGAILARLAAGRVEEAAAVLGDPRVAARRALWRQLGAHGAQWFLLTDLAAALVVARRGDPGEARRQVAAVHARIGADRLSGVDADIVTTLAAICLVAGERERARVLLDGTVWIARTPVTVPFAYRTIAAAEAISGPAAVEWRSAEVVRRYALDHAAVDAAARRMVEDELARSGLS